MADTPKVELGKETRKDILAALKGIKNQIQVSARRENTAADVAAEHIASGGGPLGALGAAVSFKAGKAVSSFKNRFDPLAIINRLTGGSKLATVLAGKLMGRSEKSIRSRAGLQPVMEESPSQMMDQGPQGSPTQDVVTQGTDKKQIVLLEAMVRSLAWIAAHISHIALKMDAIKADEEIELFKQMAENSNESLKNQEELKDQTAEDRAAYKKRDPIQQVDSNGKPLKEKSGMGLLGLLGVLWLGLKNGIGHIVKIIAVWFLKKGTQFIGFIGKTLQKSMQFIGKAISSLWEVLVEALGSVRKMIIDMIENGIAKIKGVLGIAEKVGEAGEKALPAVGEAVAKGTGVAGAVGEAAGTAVKEIGKGSAKDILEKKGPMLIAKALGKTALKALPAVGLATGTYNLAKGDYTQAGIDFAMGGASLVPGVGTAASVGIGATGVAASVGNEIYKEKYGVDPLSDPQSGVRLAGVMKDVKEYMSTYTGPGSEQLAGPTKEPGKPPITPSPVTPQYTQLPMPAPQTGQTLQQAAEMQRNAAAGMGSTNVVAPTVHHHKTINNTSQTTVHQAMPSTRSAESSFLRAQDSSYARP
jgi:hypothetical protein